MGALAMLMGFMALGHEAGAMTVQPVVIDLKSSGRGINQTVSVVNDGTYPLAVELTVQGIELGMDGAHGTGKDEGDLVAFPPQALIQVGQTQTFRLQYVGDPALASSKHYYVTVAQLPVQQPTGQIGVQVLYNFQVLASVGPQGVKPSLRIASAEIGKNNGGKPVAVVTVANDSATYGYLSRGRLSIVEKDESGREVLRQSFSGAEIQQALGLGLMASGQRRQITLPIVLPTESGSIVAQFTPSK